MHVNELHQSDDLSENSMSKNSLGSFMAEIEVFEWLFETIQRLFVYTLLYFERWVDCIFKCERCLNRIILHIF